MGLSNMVEERGITLYSSKWTSFRMFAVTLVLALIIAITAVGCAFTETKNDTEKMQIPSIPEKISVRFEADGDIPTIVKGWAIEKTEQDVSYYVDECGYTLLDAKISALSRINRHGKPD